jgi:adenylate cyclase
VSLQTCAGIRFGGFLLDRSAGGLFRLDDDGNAVPLVLGSRALDVLGVLLERQGELVAKHVIMDAVWPDTAVEENNLTVQISTLRRLLDQGRPDGSCIQTVPGRGYRFVGALPHQEGADRTIEAARPNGRASDDLPDAEVAVDDVLVAPGVAGTAKAGLARRRHGLRLAALLIGFGAVVGALLFAARGHLGWFGGPTDRPRLSLVVLPFENLGGDARDDYLADGITDDLTSDLSHIPGALVIARQSAYAYRGKPKDVRKVGEELGVRYVLEGSVRKIEALLRVNVQLTSAETGAHLWSDRFDEKITDLAAGQEQVVTRMKDKLGISMVEIESARSLRERPANPDAFDLILRARSLKNLPPTLGRQKEALALFERALVLDPTSADAMDGVAFFLMETNPSWHNFENMQRAGRLSAQARAVAPDSELFLNTYVYWLRSVGRCGEVIEAAQRAIQTDPNGVRVMTGIYHELAVCKTWTGHAEEAIALQETVNRLNPLSPWKFNRYRHMGWYSLLLGRDQDAITYLQRSLAINPDNDGNTQRNLRMLAAAYARSGQMQDARRWLSEADRLWPYDTVRGQFPPLLTSPVFVEQIRHYQAALRLAGERDHADEYADFGVPADGALHSEDAGQTPMQVSGATTLLTSDLLRLLAEARPVVIDTATRSWGRSIPGAVGLKFVGLGGSFNDAAQNRLRNRIRALTAGDRDRPIVAVGWNVERFDGLNLALRLVALGYTRVYWYRGGREAWEVNGQPEADLVLQDW